ncbi:Aim5p [Maudiozyma exigua]|uniref:Aim5p n=1 Tax=Maudiozyma exigua TaxID=34358 RepID=A0A9P7BB47_MAUEX|nr:Aim5p [Kazachstania exigua]
MGGLSRLLSFSAVSGIIGASYYLYFVKSDGYYYNNSMLKQINDKVKDVVDKKGNVETVFQDRIEMLRDKTTRDINIRSQNEMFKDLWNQQIRDTVSWIYSWGK